jgi:hypothetical protein
MPFIGAIDKDSRIGVNQVLSALSPKDNPDIYVGCSGNFTFDKMASQHGFQVHSNDVSLYSRLVAAIIQNEHFPVACINDDLMKLFLLWDETRYTTLIQVMFAMRIGQFAAKKNDYQCVMWENYKIEHRQFFDNTLKNFEERKLFDFNIASFFFGDFKEHLAQATGESTIFLYAPTYKAGYEKLYKYVEESFDYERPAYELFDSKTAGEYYTELLETKRACIYSDTLYQESEHFLVGKVDKDAGKRPVYFYTSVPAVREFYLQPSVKILSKTPVTLQYNDDITDETEITVREIPKNVVSHYKHLFMSSKVNYSLGGDYALGFFADGKLFGFAVFAKGLRTADVWETLFLHSDFVVPSKVDRLSKLLLYLLRSKDVAKLIRRHYVYAFTGLQTSVYTDKPVSMKYRGIFKKEETAEAGKLSYTAEFTEHTIEKCYKRWKNRKPL